MYLWGDVPMWEKSFAVLKRGNFFLKRKNNLRGDFTEPIEILLNEGSLKSSSAEKMGRKQKKEVL